LTDDEGGFESPGFGARGPYPGYGVEDIPSPGYGDAFEGKLFFYAETVN
jgi:hypothetical protein